MDLKFNLILVSLFLFSGNGITKIYSNVIDQNFVNSINQNHSISWNASLVRPLSTFAVESAFADMWDKSDGNRTAVVSYRNLRIKLPNEFDVRSKWPKCLFMDHIYDQGGCGDSWAIAAAEVISDRMCIVSNQKVQIQISAQDLLACCTECGPGCSGGLHSRCFKYWVANGVCTGGDYNDLSTCLPYPYRQCGHCNSSILMPCRPETMIPVCTKKCQYYYKSYYENDLHYGLTDYCIDANMEDIMKEMYLHGSVAARMTSYYDFVAYKSGIYRHVGGKTFGTRSVKLIGWGVEASVPYWLAVNSWNVDWGDRGLFKILRGSNECNIERYVCAGQPKMEDNFEFVDGKSK